MEDRLAARWWNIPQTTRAIWFAFPNTTAWPIQDVGKPQAVRPVGYGFHCGKSPNVLSSNQSIMQATSIAASEMMSMTV